jgi:hypothetical protein
MTRPDDARLRKQHTYRSLPVAEWPHADRRVWEEACRPALRLEPGGRASHFAEASLKDFAARYGAYLGSLQRRGVLNLKAAAAAQVTRSNVKTYVAELKARVCVYRFKLVQLRWPETAATCGIVRPISNKREIPSCRRS